jgi:hypothetical protein
MRMFRDRPMIRADGRIAPSRQDCGQAAWQARGVATLAGLVARNVRESGGRRTRPSLQDHGLAPVEARLAVRVALCAAPSPGARREPHDGGNWFAPLSADRMIEGNGVDTVLGYRRITDKSPVEASFPCTGAQGDARQAVCSSQILAASIAAWPWPTSVRASAATAVRRPCSRSNTTRPHGQQSAIAARPTRAA